MKSLELYLTRRQLLGERDDVVMQIFDDLSELLSQLWEVVLKMPDAELRGDAFEYMNTIAKIAANTRQGKINFDLRNECRAAIGHSVEFKQRTFAMRGRAKKNCYAFAFYLTNIANCLYWAQYHIHQALTKDL